MNPEAITAIGGAIASIIGAAGVVWASQSQLRQRVADLEKRVKAVEVERDRFRSLFRAAVRHIRDWMAWGITHAPGTPLPALPPELTDEV